MIYFIKINLKIKILESLNDVQKGVTYTQQRVNTERYLVTFVNKIRANHYNLNLLQGKDSGNEKKNIELIVAV